MVDERKLLNIVIGSIRKVLEFDPYASYAGVNNRHEFQKLMASDPAFGFLGLHDERYVIARVGGNLVTSLHRKIGDMYESLFAYLLTEAYGLDENELEFNVEVKIGERIQIRSTDGLIRKARFNDLTPARWLEYDGVGFEIRSCYQIGDSKRIQADYDMAVNLKAQNIKPVMLIMCATSLKSPVIRLRQSWELYEGKDSFDLLQEITGFDLFDFLARNSSTIQIETDRVLSNF